MRILFGAVAAVVVAALAHTALAQSPNDPNPCGMLMRPCTIVLRGQKPQLACYAPATHICTANMICAIGEARCGNGCVNRDHTVCHFEEFPCPTAAPSLCGAACFDSTQHGCENGELVPLLAYRTT
jgi:hypothetical protein